MSEFKDLYRKDLVFKSNATNHEEVFSEIGKRLIEKGLVSDDFPEKLLEREIAYPTGLDLTVVIEGSDNVAIPHTEIEFCKSKNIAFVKLENELIFKNMINPDEELPVKYLFIIINDQADNQTTVLSELMAFFTQRENIETLNKLDDIEEIYYFLTK